MVHSSHISELNFSRKYYSSQLSLCENARRAGLCISSQQTLRRGIPQGPGVRQKQWLYRHDTHHYVRSDRSCWTRRSSLGVKTLKHNGFGGRSVNGSNKITALHSSTYQLFIEILVVQKPIQICAMLSQKKKKCLQINESKNRKSKKKIVSHFFFMFFLYIPGIYY